ncbi:sigma factor-like helix-turn-helix DNA-binding protein [Nonomuraea dietziae]|uniref:sigma factor-like helix-turn-helix DNA-binding protein n=1 Tax=Nonomuraea dietziae TaxID=65515 RepID=UPI0031DD87D0
MLLLLERLSPTERAAYVLREAFDYPYRQIADIVQLNEAAVRQLVSRARRRVLVERRAPVTGAEQRRLLTAFVAAGPRSGDLTALEELFAADVTSYSDGGGAVCVPLVSPWRARRGSPSTSRRSRATSGPESTWAGRA